VSSEQARDMGQEYIMVQATLSVSLGSGRVELIDVVGSLLVFHASKNNGIISKSHHSAFYSQPGSQRRSVPIDISITILSLYTRAHTQQFKLEEMSTLPSAQFLDLPGEILSQIAS
jgi:hypothetical protein